MKTAITIFIIFALLFFIGWFGLQIQPKSFSPYPENTPELRTIPLPTGLPTPVERFYKTVYGDEIPVIETAVIKGRAVISPFNVKLPSRFVFVYIAGRDYRHYIEADFFGLPFLKVNESYLDGKSFFEVQMGTSYDEPNLNQGANLALWAEADWFPSLWLTDSRVRWEAVDDYTAQLFVPFNDQRFSTLLYTSIQIQGRSIR